MIGSSGNIRMGAMKSSTQYCFTNHLLLIPFNHKWVAYKVINNCSNIYGIKIWGNLDSYHLYDFSKERLTKHNGNCLEWLYSKLKTKVYKKVFWHIIRKNVIIHTRKIIWGLYLVQTSNKHPQYLPSISVSVDAWLINSLPLLPNSITTRTLYLEHRR